VRDKWACSAECRRKFEEQVLNYPLVNIGTEAGAEFDSIETELWYKACMSVLDTNDPTRKAWTDMQKFGIKYIMDIMVIQTTSSNHKHESDLHDRFLARALLVLAGNMERAGRPLDAAKIYEKELKMYDKARELRERDKQVVVKSTNVSLNLNQLLQQIKDGGIVAVYRCPHCGGKLKVDKNVDIAKLKVCEHCGSEIESMDLADFLKTALS
jgi:DNA-directed RNA polymerase subunit RPC12/RpoP